MNILGGIARPGHARLRRCGPVRWTLFLAWTAALLVALVGAGSVPGQEQTPQRVAVERLRQAVERDYSYRDRLKIDWTKRFAEYEARLLAAADTEEFARAAVELLGAAKDVHLFLKIGKRTIPTYRPNVHINMNPRLLPVLLAESKKHGKTVLVGKFADGIRYIAIATWEAIEPEAFQAALAAVKEAAQARAPLILDVRPNTGGEEPRARQVAAFFVDKPTAYARHISRVKGKDYPPQVRTLNPEPSGIRHPGPCVVLMGPANFSSCESFLLMMRAAGHPLIGAKSSGSSGNPQPHDLGNGIVAMFPKWRSQTADGTDLEGVGITPDIAVDAPQATLATTDPVLRKALEYLRAKN